MGRVPRWICPTRDQEGYYPREPVLLEPVAPGHPEHETS
jgi:hypothetical protein